MACNYDKLYHETPNALGDPTPVIVDFFDRFGQTAARVLDVGCGQGRDALHIARHGHHVTGVDISPNGIRDLKATAARENLSVEGVVADITGYTPDGTFNVILIDRTLHMLAKAPRLSVLANLLDHVDQMGWLLIVDEPSNIRDYEHVVLAHPFDWTAEYAKRGHLLLRRT